MPAECSIWLLPAAHQEQHLVHTVTRLSTTLGGPVFAPHVTIQGDIDLPWTALTGPVEALAANLPVQRWRVQAVEHTEHFFRRLYLRFATEPAFEHLQHAMQQVTHTAAGLSPYPHLSLAYGETHPDITRWRESLSGEFMPQEMVFDRLAINRSSKTVPIAQWENLAVFPLARE